MYSIPGRVKGSQVLPPANLGSELFIGKELSSGSRTRSTRDNSLAPKVIS